MNDSLYKEIILEHWENPLNYGMLFDPDIDITETNPLCGDEIRLMVNIKHRSIWDISFTTTGCAISKAAASLLTEEVKGKSLEKIKEIMPEDILGLVEIKLTPTRTKCALLIYQALRTVLTITRR